MGQVVLVVAPLMCILADNSRASELLNHLGASARKYCRMCMVSPSIISLISYVAFLSNSCRQIEKSTQMK